MILDAKLLSDLQACPRRFLLNTNYEVLHWRPKLLLDACLRVGIQRISNGQDVAVVASDAKAQFLQTAANPGLDAPRGTDTYKLAKDYCALLETILLAAPRWSLPALTDSPVVALNSTTQWQPLAFTDAAGELHRFVTTDRIDDGTIARELHSWYVFGDMCVTRKSMTVHVIDIGQTRNGRRASAWARGWKHPAMANLKMRFARKDGSTFKGWLPVYLADGGDAEAWVAQMYAEGVAQGLVHIVPVALPSEAVIADTVWQILQEASRAHRLSAERGPRRWLAQPMSRAACDGMIPCPFQNVCHGEMVTDIISLGLYSPRKGRAA